MTTRTPSRSKAVAGLPPPEESMIGTERLVQLEEYKGTRDAVHEI
jgi:hypothetical protein